MGDKDDLLFWQDMFLMPMPEMGKLEDFTKHLPECKPIGFKPIEFDSLNIPRQTFEPLTNKIPPINFDIPKEDMEHFRRMVEEPLFKENDNLIARLRHEVEKQVMSLIIEGEPTINKPKNLKYPHKKRKRRILKKWAKRFGVTPNQLVIPEAEVEVGVAPDENGLLLYTMSVKPKKQP